MWVAGETEQCEHGTWVRLPLLPKLTPDAS